MNTIADDTQQQIVLEILELLHQKQPDFVKFAEAFDEDTYYQVHVPAIKPLRGRDQIVTELARQFSDYEDCDCEIIACAASGHFVFTERRDHVTMKKNGQRIFSSVCAVFEFNAQQKIIAWREYWDIRDIQYQLGMTEEQMLDLLPRDALIQD
ncbi:MAG: limonene-1,2-epoxide hydrolase family protein [Spongiibacteraceae bacterium]